MKAQKPNLQFKDSEIARLEKAVNNLTQELQTAISEKDIALQAKNNFLARVSHDLRSPLTSILGYAHLIEAEPAAGADKKAGVIINSANRLLSMIDDLINYAANDQNQLKTNQQPTYTYNLINNLTHVYEFDSEIIDSLKVNNKNQLQTTEKTNSEYFINKMLTLLNQQELEQIIELTTILATSQIANWAENLKQQRPETKEITDYLVQLAADAEVEELLKINKILQAQQA